jgi:hypothetical protein
MIGAVLKYGLVLLVVSLSLFSCKGNSNGVASTPPPTIKASNDSIMVAPGSDTTITVHIDAAAGIKSVKATTSKGSVHLKNKTGIGTNNGSVDVVYDAPPVKERKVTYLTIIATDKHNQSNQSKIKVIVSPSISAMNQLQHIIEDVTGSTSSRFDVKDDQGNNMATVKIIDNLDGGFIAVYHTNEGDNFKVSVAASNDLLHWTLKTKLGNNASQPYIAQAPDGGFVTVWEQTPHNHLRFRYYKNLTDLFKNDYTKQFDAPQTLSKCAEGTPNIISASKELVKVGFHYYRNCQVDREALGTLKNFTTWEPQVNTKLNKAIINDTAVQNGKIGDRDQINFKGYIFILVEAQLTLNDFGSWRVFLYNKQTGRARMMHISTKGGSKNFANPALTNLNLNGEKAIVVTLFVPSNNAAPGEAGELVYYMIL